jgi:hypothetical protein
MFGTISGSVLGAVTNWFNGYVSPKYFEQVMGWYSYATGISAAAIREGILEGAVNGASLSIIFIALIAAMSHGHFRLLVAIKYALFAFSAAIALWFIGGGLAVLYVLLSSNPSTRWFGNHGSADTVLPYAWVRGSIMAIVFGGPFAVTTSLVCYALRHCAPVARYRN